MAFVKFYKCTCENERVDKTDYLSGWNSTTYQINVIENGTNEDEYIFTFNESMDDMSQYNYCYIDGSYYFMNTVKAQDGDYCEITATLDVLMSNKDAILESEQIIERNSVYSNAYIVDNEITCASYDTINCVEFPNGLQGNDSIILITSG